MSRVIRRLFFVACLVLGHVAFGIADVHAQSIVERDRTDGRVVYEMEADWPMSLRAAVDSAGIDSFTADVALYLSHGVTSESRALKLRDWRLPVVDVVATDYEEVQLPEGEVDADVLEEYAAPVSQAVALGAMRRQPVATLAMALLRYDRERQVLRRYRRVTAAVELPQAPTAPTGAHVRASRTGNMHLDVTSSVLSEGLILKLPVNEEGVYRFTYSVLEDMLADTDLDVSDVDPARMQLFGNGGAPLPALAGAPRPADLVENPVWIKGGGDGSFDEGDALIFFGAGAQGWRFEAASEGGNGEWEHYVHPFSNTNYYFLKINGERGARLSDPSSLQLEDPQVYDEVEGRHVVDFDAYKWKPEGEGTGLTWMSNQILPGSRFTVLDNVVLPGLAAGSVDYVVRGAARARPATQLNFEVNGQHVGSLNPGMVGTSSEASIARVDLKTFGHVVQADEPVTMTMTVEDRPSEPTAAVDWVRVFYPQRLRAEGGILRFATPGGVTGPVEFRLEKEGFDTRPQVWDVTQPGRVRRLAVSEGDDVYRVQLQLDNPDVPRELVAFTNVGIQTVDPAGVEKVAPQNLHGIDVYPEFVIVAPEPFVELAEELAARRRAQGMEVLVAERDAIYNEFSGGLPDMRAVRDFLKFLYDRGPGGSEPALRYALLFGDGHFNYRSLGEEGDQGLENWIFPYETEESLNPDRSYTSDDYFGLLDDKEGRWPYAGYSRSAPVGEPVERIDIGIGRFPIQTEEEGRALLDKIYRYENGTTHGAWRSRYLFIADDGYNGLAGVNEDDELHVKNAEAAVGEVEEVTPEMNLRKVYGPSYHEQRVFRNGYRIPAMHQDIMSTLNDGVLVFNYSGHGSPDGLAQERIYTTSDAMRLRNRDRLPIFITATCSFGRWDMQNRQSAAEATLLNPDGGAVAVFSTVRLVYTGWSDTSLNPGLNRAINKALLSRDEDGIPRRLGDVIHRTKQTNVGLVGNSRKFNLLGDPSMRVGLPRLTAEVTEVNGTATDSAGLNQLRALDRVHFAGEVRGSEGTLAADFDGRATVTVYDVERQVRMPYARQDSTYSVREDVIWRGDVGVRGGHFTAEFVMPKDISYQNAPGRISVYAKATDLDAIGHTEDVRIGGTSDNPPDDQEGPTLRLFLNDTTFVSGGLTAPDPDLLVHLRDESGLNAVGAGVGHEMLLVVDGEDQHAVNLGDRYTSEEDSYQHGRVEYSLADYPEPIEPGPHRLTVRAWDVVNNASEAELEFYVSGSEALELRNVYNYPNPTPGSTYFIFEHNQPSGTPADVQVRIYTLTGRLVRTIDGSEALPAGVLEAGPVKVPGHGRPWDGLDQDGDPLAPGVYLYKVRVETESIEGDRNVSERIERLAILR